MSPAHAALPPRALRPAARGGDPMQWTGVGVLMAFLFVAFSRLPDLTVPGLHLAFVLSLLSLVACVLSGGLQRVWAAQTGKMLMAFTFWMLVSAAFGLWRGGSIFMMKDVWLKSLAMFVVMVGLIRTLPQARMVALTIGLGTTALALEALLIRFRVMGRLSFPVGMFTNPNDLAQALLLGLPFWFLMGSQSRNPFRRVITVAAATPVLIAIGQTGSRAVILAVGVVALFVFFFVSLRAKILLVVAGIAGTVLLVVWAPESVRVRLLALSQDEVNQEDPYGEEAVAVSSAESRKVLLIQSLKLTARHPLLGVGPGNFQVASNQDMNAQGQRGLWRETHNMYTQVSCETGIPGFLLYFGTVAVIFSRWRSLMRRTAGIHHLRHVRTTLLCAATSLVGLLVTGAFSSIAYHFLLPAVLGLLTAFLIAGESEVSWSAAVTSGPQPESAPRPPLGRPVRPVAASRVAAPRPSPESRQAELPPGPPFNSARASADSGSQRDETARRLSAERSRGPFPRPR